MSFFHVAMGFSSNELNGIMRNIYNKVFPELFTGADRVERNGIAFDISYRIPASPRFNLDSKQPETQAALILQGVEIKASAPDGVNTVFKLDLTVICQLATSEKQLKFLLREVTFNPLPGELDQWIAQSFLVPRIKETMQKVFAGFVFPDFDLPGIPLSGKTAIIDRNQLIILASMGAPGHVYPGFSWPAADFYLLINEKILWAAAGEVLKRLGRNIRGEDNRGSRTLGVWYGYNFRLSLSKMKIEGNNLILKFIAESRIEAIARVVIPLPLSYIARCVPYPQAVCGIYVENRDVNVKTKDVSRFEIKVQPTGSIPRKVLGWMTHFIVNGIIKNYTYRISDSLRGVSFSSFRLPLLRLMIGGKEIVLQPAINSTREHNNDLLLSGNLK